MKFYYYSLKAKIYFEIVLFLHMIVFPACLFSKTIKEPDVLTAVETWVRYVTADARPEAMVSKMEPYKVEGETIAYIAHLSENGFCICGASDLVLPVYLYSPRGTYDAQNPNYQYILWEIDTRMKNLQRIGKMDSQLQFYEELSQREILWQDLVSGRIPPKMIQSENILADPDSMIINFASHWHQGAPYNNLCPLHENASQRCVVGCVATAMSQIIYYWQWPNTGAGSEDVNYEFRWRNNWDSEPLGTNPNIPAGWAGRLEWTSANGGLLQMNGNWDESVLRNAQAINGDSDYQDALQNLYDNLNRRVTNWSANFGATTYQLDHMADEAGSLPAGGIDAVATLCYHAGVAVQMDYGIEGSGALMNDANDALEDNFRYSRDASCGSPDIQEITENIQWLRPVMLGGHSNSGAGHAWVIYGYNKRTDPNRQFLMNMGWGGNGDDWYSCDNIDYNHDNIPDFNIDQEQIIQIAPLKNAQFVGNRNSGDGSPDSPHKDIEDAIRNAPSATTLIFKAGSTNTFSANTLVIDRPFTIKGLNVTIQKQ